MPKTHLSQRKPDKEKIRIFLQQQENMRFFSDFTPGFGNQAATQSLITRLREDLGYTGSVEVIYPRSTTAKITTLYDLPDMIPACYFDPHHNITFRTISHYANALLTGAIVHNGLGMTGANDYFYTRALQEEGFDVAQLSQLQQDNAANFFESDVYVYLTAFYEHINYLEKYNQTHEYRQSESEYTFLWSPYATLNDTRRYLMEHPRGQAFLQSKPALKTYIQGMEDGAFQVMSMYGYTLQQNEYGFPWDVLQLICAASGLTYAWGHPLILPVFYDYREESRLLYDLIHHRNWTHLESSWRARDAVHDYILDFELPARFQIADLNDESTIDVISRLEPRDVLLLSMGPMPKIIFEGLFTYNAKNIFPQVYEGENTFYSLVHGGKPHLRCSPYWEVTEDVSHNPSFSQALQAFYQHVCDGPASWFDPPYGNIVKLISDYLREASYPESELTVYFHDLKEFAELPEHDRVLLGLEEALEISETRIAPDVVPEKTNALSPVMPKLQTSGAERTVTSHPVYDLLIKPAQQLGRLFNAYLDHLLPSLDAKEMVMTQAILTGLTMWAGIQASPCFLRTVSDASSAIALDNVDGFRLP